MKLVVERNRGVLYKNLINTEVNTIDKITDLTIAKSLIEEELTKQIKIFQKNKEKQTTYIVGEL